MLVDLGSCCVFSQVRLCLVFFFFVRESPPLWRGFVTKGKTFFKLCALKSQSEASLVHAKLPRVPFRRHAIQ